MASVAARRQAAHIAAAAALNAHNVKRVMLSGDQLLNAVNLEYLLQGNE